MKERIILIFLFLAFGCVTITAHAEMWFRQAKITTNNGKAHPDSEAGAYYFGNSVSISEDEAKEKALASPRVKKHTEGKKIVKVIYVAGRLVNIVVR